MSINFRHKPITAAADRVPYGYRKPQRILLHVKRFHTGSKCKPAKSRKWQVTLESGQACRTP